MSKGDLIANNAGKIPIVALNLRYCYDIKVFGGCCYGTLELRVTNFGHCLFMLINDEA